eukprot:jgi/Bigna1/86622/estExt_fgenesh1_pg.C_120088
MDIDADLELLYDVNAELEVLKDLEVLDEQNSVESVDKNKVKEDNNSIPNIMGLEGCESSESDSIQSPPKNKEEKPIKKVGKEAERKPLVRLIKRNRNISKPIEAKSLTKSKAVNKDPPQKSQENTFTEEFSGVRVKNRVVGSADLRGRLSNVKVVKVGAAVSYASSHPNADFAVIGIVANKSDARETKRGDKFAIWRLTDFSREITVFLFGDAFKRWWDVRLGSLVCLGKPALKDSSTNYSTPAFSVQYEAQLLKIGVAMDFGFCRGYRKDSMERCKHYINTRSRQFCDVHIRKEYTRKMGRRMELNHQSQRRVWKKPRHAESAATKSSSFMGGTTRKQSSRSSSRGIIVGGAVTGGSRYSRQQLLPAAAKGNGKKKTMDTILKESHQGTNKSRFAKRLVRSSAALKLGVASSPSAAVASSAKTHAAKKMTGKKGLAVSTKPVLKKSSSSSKKKGTISQNALSKKNHHQDKTETVAVCSSESKIKPKLASAPSQARTGGADNGRKAGESSSRRIRRRSSEQHSASPLLAKLKKQVQEQEVEIQRLLGALDGERRKNRSLQLQLEQQQKEGALPRRSTFNSIHTPKGMSDARKRAASIVKKVGGLKPTDPNNVSLDGVQAKLRLKRKRQQQQQLSINSSGKSSAWKKTGGGKVSEFGRVFGHIDANSAKAKAIVQRESVNKDHLAREERAEWLSKLDKLEEIEKLQEQVASITETKAYVWRCENCHKTREKFNAVCKKEGHRQKKISVTRRFFECTKCSWRTSTIKNILPVISCGHCGGRNYRKASAMNVAAKCKDMVENRPGVGGEAFGIVYPSEKS